ncbi:C40 family peptidase [Paenibacillus caui]|uniref:C40 family peptidase n=1 Tax=Paenibacillus caui TaxID=2873927 RepID=UPI001CA88FD7|nr:C40 family peptidase [Paenibacillus caui]
MKLTCFTRSLSLTVLLLFLITVCAGCGAPNNTDGQPSAQGTRSLSMDNKQGYPDSKSTLKPVPLSLAAKELGLRVEKRGDEYLIGYTDVMYRVKPGEAKALSMNRPIVLSHAPEARKSDLYFTVSALGDLLGTQVGWDPLGHIVSLSPFPGTLADDKLIPGYNSRLSVKSAVDSDQLIDYAKKFLGTKYEFGAENYEKSGTFDCSSFTKHVFKEFNVRLPRLARDQAHTGNPVEKSELEPGDLVFFTVPGRFKDDKIAGHVGIYIGNGNFIHTWGDPGVEISSLESGHWSKVMLGARRVI